MEISKYPLVHLGRPVTGVFKLEIGLMQADWSGGGGVFFRGRQQTSDDGSIFRFQSIELLSTDSETDIDTRRLMWSQWSFSSNDKEVASERKNNLKRNAWAEVKVKLALGAKQQHLQILLGRRGMPEVWWNGLQLHETTWKLSTKGRRQQQLPAEKLPMEYLGRLGVENLHGKTTFVQPRLAYL